MPLPSPKTRAQWLELLDKQPLPVTPQALQQVTRALGDSRRSLRDIGEIMQRTPTLALCIMREANRSASALGEPCAHLETALSRLGLERSAQLISRQPTLPVEQIPRQLRQILLISQHAAQQANGLFAGRLARLWQEINWGSTLFLAPLWPLVAAHPEFFDEWEQRVLLNGEQACKVEKQLLGVSLPSLCLALAEHWRLPEWIIQAYRLLLTDRRLLVRALHIARDNEHPLQQQQCLDQDNNLSRWLTHPANSVLLANAIALSAHHCWSGPHSLRWQQLTGLYLQATIGELQQQIHQQAAVSARRCDTEQLWHPAQALLWPWDAVHLRPNVASAPAKTDAQQWRLLCAQLLQSPSAFSNTMQLSSCAIQALQAAGMQRLLLLRIDQKQSALKVQELAGLPAEAADITLLPLQSQVLRSLLAKPGQLHLTPANIAQFSALLPGPLKALFAGENLLLRSVANEGRVVMLLVADINGQPLSETQLKIFGKTAQCIDRALTSFANRAG